MKGKIAKSLDGGLTAVDQDERIVEGVVVTADTLDCHGEFMSRDTVKKTMENYHSLLSEGKAAVDILHTGIKTGFPLASSIDNSGNWVMKSKVTDEATWQLVKNGTIRGYSIWGNADRVEKDIGVELVNPLISRVSLVRDPANHQQFMVIKDQDQGVIQKTINYLQGIVKKEVSMDENERLTRIEKSVESLANVVSRLVSTVPTVPVVPKTDTTPNQAVEKSTEQKINDIQEQVTLILSGSAYQSHSAEVKKETGPTDGFDILDNHFAGYFDGK